MTIECWCKSKSGSSGNTNDARIIVSFDRSAVFRFSIGFDGDASAADKAALAEKGVGIKCKKGLKPEAPNQDSFIYLHHEAEQGELGHVCGGLHTCPHLHFQNIQNGSFEFTSIIIHK